MLQTGMLKRWRWIEPDPQQQAWAQTLARELNVHPLVACLLVRRGQGQIEPAQRFLEPKLNDLHDPATLPGVSRAAQRMEQAVRDGQPIVIYGDYDVDGVCASAILWQVLTLAGAEVQTYIPHRIEEGYGLNSQAIRALAEGRVQTSTGPLNGRLDGGGPGARPLIVSVDCGITALEPARVARDLDVDLIITDHHEFEAAHLPEAHTLVHPRLNSSSSPDQPVCPFASLCGAGVAFKLAWEFAKLHCGSQRVPDTYRGLLLDLLSLAALGTVADVVPLVDENRIITAFGLGQIKRTRFAGLNALIDAAGLRQEKISAYHVGFVLGPRLNACGRMGHARQALRLLLTSDPAEAAELAAFLTSENDRRRGIERDIFLRACQMVSEGGYDRREERALVLGHAGWHPGVLGIVAARLVDSFACPVVMLNYENGQAQGSARSVEGVSIHEAISHCRDLLTSFGGHAMAAGLRLEERNVHAFRQALIQYVNQRLSAEDLVEVLEVDSLAQLREMTQALVEQIHQLAPFGRGNPHPLFLARQVRLAYPPQRVGGQGKHLRLALRDGPQLVYAVVFGLGEQAEQLAAGMDLDVVYEPRLSHWQGRTRPEFHLKDLQRSTA